MRLICPRLRQSFRWTALDRLPEDRRVAVALELKGDSCPIRRPRWEPCVPAERESPCRGGTVQVVDPDACFLAIIRAEREPLSIRRHTRRFVRTRRKRQPF